MVDSGRFQLKEVSAAETQVRLSLIVKGRIYKTEKYNKKLNNKKKESRTIGNFFLFNKEFFVTPSPGLSVNRQSSVVRR